MECFKPGWEVCLTAYRGRAAGSPGSRLKSFAASADLERAVTVLFDSSISVWDVPAAALLCVLQTRGERNAAFGHSSGVNDVAMSSDGAVVVTVAKDETARVWSVDSGRGIHILRGAVTLARSQWPLPEPSVSSIAGTHCSLRILWGPSGGVALCHHHCCCFQYTLSRASEAARPLLQHDWDTAV